MYEPLVVRSHPAGMGGIQKIFRFPNNYGASVVRFYGSYGYEEGLWELGVIGFMGDGDDDFMLTYETPLGDDVIGHLTESAVEKTLTQIAALPVVTKETLLAEKTKRDAWMDETLEKIKSREWLKITEQDTE